MSQKTDWPALLTTAGCADVGQCLGPVPAGVGVWIVPPGSFHRPERSTQKDRGGVAVPRQPEVARQGLTTEITRARRNMGGRK